MTANKTKWVRLGDYIELCDERNRNLSVTLSQGIANTKVFQAPKQVSANSKNDKIVRTGQFAYNRATTRNGEKISIALRTGLDCTVSSAYCVFQIKDESILNPYYLWLFFSRSEFDRYARYTSQGSAHEFFDWEDMCRVKIPLPSIGVQEELVSTYQGLQSLAEDNEALIAPLTQACEALVVDCKRMYKLRPLGNFIEEVKVYIGDKPNYEVRGINMTYGFIPTVANMTNIDISKYKMVPKGHFACNLMHVGRDVTIPIAYNSLEDNIAVSPAYYVFCIKARQHSVISPSYLSIILGRKEFGRLAWFHTIGSVRGNLPDKTLNNIEIPIPPPEVQESIVNLYRCLEEAKRIAAEARQQMRNLCPALIQKAIHSA